MLDEKSPRHAAAVCQDMLWHATPRAHSLFTCFEYRQDERHCGVVGGVTKFSLGRDIVCVKLCRGPCLAPKADRKSNTICRTANKRILCVFCLLMVEAAKLQYVYQEEKEMWKWPSGCAGRGGYKRLSSFRHLATYGASCLWIPSPRRTVLFREVLQTFDIFSS